MDVVVGWFRLKPGKRGEFLAYTPSFTSSSRQRPGILFCEITASPEDEDVAVLAIGFADKVSHDASIGRQEEADLIALLERIGVEASFENFSGERGRRDTLTFSGKAREQQLDQMRTR